MACVLDVDLDANEIRKGDLRVAVGPVMAEIAFLLAQAFPDPISSPQIANGVYGVADHVSDEAGCIWRNISRLRRHLVPLGIGIRASRKRGYQLVIGVSRPGWTDDEIARLQSLPGKTDSDIEQDFPGRTIASVLEKCRKLGLATGREKTRGVYDAIAPDVLSMRRRGMRYSLIAKKLGVKTTTVAGAIYHKGLRDASLARQSQLPELSSDRHGRPVAARAERVGNHAGAAHR